MQRAQPVSRRTVEVACDTGVHSLPVALESERLSLRNDEAHYKNAVMIA